VSSQPSLDVVIKEIGPTDHAEAATLISRAMSENPIHVAVWPDPETRRAALKLGVENNLSTGRRFAWGAWAAGRLAGVAVVARPDSCRPSRDDFRRSRQRMGDFGPGVAERWAAWRDGWGAQDPTRSHAHFGPFAVTEELRGRGIGSLLMRRFCAYLDELEALGHLEADKEANVPFYEGFGFRALAAEPVVGVTTWFMSRESGASAGVRM
jgi:GNAT superfamily N-acetyltransferase